MRKVKIGFVPCFHGNARGDMAAKTRVLSQLIDLAEKKGFELYPVERIVYGYDSAKEIVKEIKEQDLDFLFLGSFGATIGNCAIPFMGVPCPVGIWAVPEGTSEGILPLNAFCGSMILAGMFDKYYKEDTIPFKWFYGFTDNPLFAERFDVTLKALKAAAALKESRIAAIGPVVDGFDYMLVSESKIEKLYGAHIERLHTIDEIIRRADCYEQSIAEKEVERILEEGVQDKSVSCISLEKSARLFLALRDFAAEGGFNALAVSCWSTLQEVYGAVPCAAISRLNNQGLIVSCEGDIDGAVGMIADRAFNDGIPASMVDLVSIDMQDSSLNIWHCGPAPGHMANDSGIRWDSHFNMGTYKGEQWCGCGVVADLQLREGTVTLNRICSQTDELIVFTAEVFPKAGYQGSSGWLHNFKMEGNEITIEQLISLLYNYRVDHHMAFGYGDNENAFLEFANWKGLKTAVNKKYVPYMELRG